MGGDDHIRCGDCGKSQPHMRYSNNQLKRYDERVRSKGKNKAALPNCKSCSGEPATDAECYGCHKYLPVAAFKKAQRKNKDHRLCDDCSQAKSDREPDVQDAIEEEKIYADMMRDAGGTDSVWSGSAVRSALPSILNNSTLPSASNSRLDDEVWVTKSQPSHSNPPVRSSASASDEGDTGSQMGGSITGTHRSNETWAKWADSKAIEQGHQSVTSGWHKQGAVKQDAHARAKARADKDKGSKTKQQEEELSSEAGSDDESDFEI